MNWLVIAKVLMGLLPVVMDATKAVEAAVPQSGQGAQKLRAVVSAVQGAALAVPVAIEDAGQVKQAATVGDIPGIVSAVEHMVSTVVDVFNQTGIFKKSTQ